MPPLQRSMNLSRMSAASWAFWWPRVGANSAKAASAAAIASDAPLALTSSTNSCAVCRSSASSGLSGSFSMCSCMSSRSLANAFADLPLLLLQFAHPRLQRRVVLAVAALQRRQPLGKVLLPLGQHDESLLVGQQREHRLEVFQRLGRLLVELLAGRSRAAWPVRPACRASFLLSRSRLVQELLQLLGHLLRHVRQLLSIAA